MNSRSFAATCALHSEAGGSGRTRRGPNGAGVPRPIGPMGLLPSVCAAIQVPLDHSMTLDLGWQKKDPNYIYLLGLPVGKAGFADLLEGCTCEAFIHPTRRAAGCRATQNHCICLTGRPNQQLLVRLWRENSDGRKLYIGPACTFVRPAMLRRDVGSAFLHSPPDTEGAAPSTPWTGLILGLRT